MNYNTDKLKTMQRDVTPALISGFAYITLASLGNPVCGREPQSSQGAKPAGTVSVSVQNVDDISPGLPATIRIIPTLPDIQVKFSSTKRVRPYGAIEYSSDRFYTDAKDLQPLSKQEAQDLADAWIKTNLPDYVDSLRLREVAPIIYEEYGVDGSLRQNNTVGYLVTYVQAIKGLPLLAHTVRVRILGREIAGCLIRVSELTSVAPTVPPKVFLRASDAFKPVLPELRRKTGTLMKTASLLSGAPVYWIGFNGTDPVQIGKPYEAKLVYRFLVGDRECDTLPCSKGSWWVLVDAKTGRVLDLSKN